MENVQDILAKIDNQYKHSNPAEMEIFFENTLEEYSDNFGKMNIGYATILNEAGSFYRGRSNYEKSELCFEESTSILKTLLGDKSVEYATALNNMAELYRLWGKKDKCESILFNVLEIFKETVGEKHLLYSSCLNYLGHLYQENEEYDKALDVYTQSLEIVKELPDNEALLATAYNNIAGPLKVSGKAEEALGFLEKSKELYENKLGTGDPHYIAVLNSIATLYQYLKEYQQASEYYLRTLELSEKFYGKSHPKYGVAASNYATCCEDSGNLDEAIIFAKVAADSFVESLGPNNQNTERLNKYAEHLINKKKEKSS